MPGVQFCCIGLLAGLGKKAKRYPFAFLLYFLSHPSHERSSDCPDTINWRRRRRESFARKERKERKRPFFSQCLWHNVSPPICGKKEVINISDTSRTTDAPTESFLLSPRNRRGGNEMRTFVLFMCGEMSVVAAVAGAAASPRFCGPFSSGSRFDVLSSSSLLPKAAFYSL